MLWIKAFHIIAMVTWFAALFYLPRLFVYHAGSTDTLSIDRFKRMESRLYWGIMVPSMLLTLVLGVWLLALNAPYYLASAWMHAKLSLVVLLVIYHHYCGYLMKQFAKGNNCHSSTFYRWFNELPALFLITVVILVVVRPF
jgi:putative membrane protein